MNLNTKFIVLFTTSLVLSFALGGTLGYFAPHPYSLREDRGPGGPGGREMKKKMLERMSQTLELTEDQKQKVREIFESHEPQMRQLHELAKPKFEAIRNATRAEIRKILTPEQLVKFEELNARMDARMNERMEKHEFKKDFPPAP